MKTVEVLERAKQLLQDGGWCQHVGVYGSRHCMIGAITTVADDEDSYQRAKLALLGVTKGLLHHWNDVPGRTVEEVLAAFDKAIQSCKS